MKKSLLVLFVVFTTTLSYGKVIRTIEMTKVAYNNSGDTLHGIANRFADSVGILLKYHYPARVGTVYVELDFDEKTKLFSLTYYAEIQQSNMYEYDWYFEHAGALSVSSSISTAKKDALLRMKQQELERKQKFHKVFGNYGDAGGLHFDLAETGKNYWVIYESFIVAR